MEQKRVAVCGGGVLGSQIAWQVARNGFYVNVFDINEEAIDRCKNFLKKYSSLFNTEEPFERINYYTNLKSAVRGVFLVIESVPENVKIKKEFYNALSKSIPKDTPVATNSSTMLPSELKGFIENPSRFLALHFANPVWDAGIVEIMGYKETNKSVFELLVKFAEDIGMIPIKIYKEQRGYVLNTLLVPFLAAAQHLYFTGIADYKDIDKVWMLSAKSQIGPFGIMDLIGMKTIYDVVLLDAKRSGSKELFERAERIKKEFLDKGKLGVESNEGFYKYPNPEYEQFRKK